MVSGFFKGRVDGTKHHWCHALPHPACQYCIDVWTHEFDTWQKKAFDYKPRNQVKVVRCLTYNVHLCSDCDMEFHGFTLPTVG